MNDNTARYYDDETVKMLAERQLAGERLPKPVLEKLTPADVKAFAAHLPAPQTLNILALAQGPVLTVNSRQVAKNERDKIVSILRQHLADVEAERGIAEPIRPYFDLKNASDESPTSDYPARVLALTMTPMFQDEFRKYAAQRLSQVIADLEAEDFKSVPDCESLGVVFRATNDGQLQLMTGKK